MTWESQSAGVRFTKGNSSYDLSNSWALHLDGERTGGELFNKGNFVLTCQKGAGHLTERQRDAILRLLGTSGGPRIVIFQRFYDYLELDRLYAEYGGR